MEKFKFDKKDTYSHEDIERLLREKESHTKKVVATEKEAEFNEVLSKKQAEWEQGFTAKKSNEDFLNSIPQSENKLLVERLLSSGSTTDEIANQFPNLLKPVEQKTITASEFEALLEGKTFTAPVAPQEDENLFVERMTNGTGSEPTDADWNRFAELKKQNKI